MRALLSQTCDGGILAREREREEGKGAGAVTKRHRATYIIRSSHIFPAISEGSDPNLASGIGRSRTWPKCPEFGNKCLQRFAHLTLWPFKLNLFLLFVRCHYNIFYHYTVSTDKPCDLWWLERKLFMHSIEDCVTRKLIVGAFSPISHKWLHQGLKQTSVYLQVIHSTSHYTTNLFLSNYSSNSIHNFGTQTQKNNNTCFGACLFSAGTQQKAITVSDHCLYVTSLFGCSRCYRRQMKSARNLAGCKSGNSQGMLFT